ncbi:Dynein heavy chain 6, axonemal [Dissostichus eleginoides]|nr:Dynein heavy chain 6, axonemal [Dissostichus eleginoides]
MEAEVKFLRDQVHRLNSALSQYQYEHGTQSTSAQVEDARRAEAPKSWMADRSIMAPLIAEYDLHMEEMTEKLQRYEGLMTDVKVKLERVVKENERLHAELRESVEKQLHVLPVSSGVEGGTLEEEAVIRNLQEQLQLCEQERVQAMELGQTAAQELDRLHQTFQKTVSDGHIHGAQRQQLKDQLVQFQQHTHKLQVANQNLESTNQQFLKTVTEQSTEMEDLHSQHRQSKAELRTATAKVDEMTKLLQSFQDQMQRREEDVAEAQGREDAADRRLQQLQAALSQLEARLKAATQEAEAVRRDQTVWERKVGELQNRCGTLEEEKYEALAKVRESVQVAEEATLQKEQVLLREKQKKDELEKTKEAIKQLIQDAAVRTRKEVDNVRKQCNVQIHRMAEELSALQLECADKESQIERSLRERKAVEEELEKVYKEGRAEPEFRKIEALHQRCLDAERMKEDMSLTLQGTKNRLKKMEMDYSEEISRCQEEVQRLQSSLVSARDDCVGVSEERLQLQRENLQLRKEMDELRKATMLVQKKAKQQLAQMEQEYSLKEQGLDARVQELEDSSRSSCADLTRLLAAQQKSTQRWKEEAKNLVQAFETKMTGFKGELNRQKQRSHELEMQLEKDHNTVAEYERQLAEYQEKASRLQRRLTQSEQKATTATQQPVRVTHHGLGLCFSPVLSAEPPRYRSGKWVQSGCTSFLKSRAQKTSNQDLQWFKTPWPFSIKSTGIMDTHTNVVYEYSKEDFLMISPEGVVTIYENKVDFITTERWEEEYNYHCKLIRIPFFIRFNLWKPFYVWHSKVQAKKIHSVKESLQRRLCIVNECLGPALIDIKKMCYQISDTGLCHIEKEHIYTLQEFREFQFKQLQEVKNDLEKFQDLVKEVTICACRNYLRCIPKEEDEGALREGLEGPDGSSLTYTDHNVNNFSLFATDDNEFLAGINKTFYSNRVICFIRLVDFIVVDTLYILMANAVAKLLSVLKEHVQQTPSHDVIQSWNQHCEVATDTTKEEMDKKPGRVQPMFITELILEPNTLTYKPSEENFQETIKEVIGWFEETVKSVNVLTADPDFDSMTEARADEHKYVDDQCDESIIESDGNLQSVIQNIEELLQFAFDAAKVYSRTFEHFQLFYKENEALDLDAMRQQDNGLSFFGKALELHHSQHKEAAAIQQKRHLGLLLVDKTKLKDKLVSSPLRCLEVINEVVTQLAKKKLDAVIAEACKAQYKLECTPSTTEELAESLITLDEIQERITVLEEEQETVCQLYNLINTYSVPTPPEDLFVFATLQPTISSLHSIIDGAALEREASMGRLGSSMHKDIKELNREVTQVKLKAQNPQNLDIKSDPSQVRLLLGGVQISIDELQAKASAYISYQKKFKVEVTKFDALEELTAEFRLTKLLWDSMEEWDSLSEGWRQSTLEQLDLDQFSSQVTKYSKYVNQLEKGLPRNNVVPSLKDKVELMKQRLPLITDLRNPCMKAEHWRTLESVVGTALSGEELTVAALETLDVFSYGTEIQEVSGQASGEASVETIITKVEDMWRTAEFTVLSHSDSKDVFILGGTDDIQVVLLDDGIINVSTVASSRYLAPIKPRVDKLLRQLTLFNQTLDEWLTCQRNWLYLESIFLAPDIKRQLPAESKMFLKVDKSWKAIMAKVNTFPNAMKAATQPDLLETFQHNNELLDEIQKCLEDYLESKRVIFPRFCFLSNDELLKILAQTRNPQAVQPHLTKCFDAIIRLDFALLAEQSSGATAGSESNQESIYSKDILSMVSPEGEKVALTKGLKAQGNVEDWLCKVEEAMFNSLRRLSKAAIADYQVKSREEWVVAGHASQVVLTISQLMWCRDMDACLEGDHDRFAALQEFELINIDRLIALAALVRGELPALHRNIITALITTDVHARDIVTELIQQKVDSRSNFEWQRQLRYYWDLDQDTCVAKMALSTYIYGYEYLGACPRLVITPLTDRCYLCLMGALQLDLGGAPAGPAGTGKTETTKDLAKAMAIQCVVFNCSDGLDYKMMGRFFSGLAMSGAWCCFDEFNRIDIEVLSVIAQQLITIRNAKADKLSKFHFEGREIKLVMTCAAFITMNPGYAGRTELPDNLKALFRPIAMMVPNYALIAEVSLYSEGFESSKTLARKMTQMYKLCSEQLSQQDHYDFGMRAVKSVLVMAGSLKRENPHLSEDVVLIRALRDSNLPKFLTDDAMLFGGILSDLFPGVSIPDHDYGVLHTTIQESLVKRNLQPLAGMTKKVIELYETMLVRHGVMLVGPTGGGKTTVYRILADTLETLQATGHKANNPFFQHVKTYILNPKSVTMGELYGEVL